MLIKIIKQLNWVDILVVILLVRICYISIKNGLPLVFFKLLGTFFAIYLSLHYYTRVTDGLRVRVAALYDKLPLEFMDFFSFLALVLIGYLIFVLLRSVFYRFIKMEAVPTLNKWGGLILGILRAYLLAGLIMYTLVMSSMAYLKNGVYNSYIGRSIFKVAPNTYSWLWHNLAAKFMTKEKFNQTVLEVQEGFLK